MTDFKAEGINPPEYKRGEPYDHEFCQPPSSAPDASICSFCGHTQQEHIKPWAKSGAGPGLPEPQKCPRCGAPAKHYSHGERREDGSQVKLGYWRYVERERPALPEPELAAFDRAEFDELLREVVALREWKAAHEDALYAEHTDGDPNVVAENAARILDMQHGGSPAPSPAPPEPQGIPSALELEGGRTEPWMIERQIAEALALRDAARPGSYASALYSEMANTLHSVLQSAGVGAPRVPTDGPWKVVSPAEYAGADNPYLKDAVWIVRSDERPGHSAIVGNEAEAIAVRDALNRVAGGSQEPRH